MSNPLEIEIHVETIEGLGLCSVCNEFTSVFEFVLFIGSKPIYTDKKYCEYCYEKLNDEK